MYNRHKIYIGGAWVPSTSTEVIDVVNPFTEEVIGRVPAGTAEDVGAAVAAARAAFDAWSRQPVSVRASALRTIADLIDANTPELAELATSEVGTPVRNSPETISACSWILRDMAENIEGLTLEEQIEDTRTFREPIGVVAAITPWNYPLYQTIAKIAPAIAAGCSVVLKPSEVAPLAVFRLMELIAETDLPAGVINLVSGYGVPVGEALAAHPAVDMITLTGSLSSGARVTELGAATAKRITLELGGKSANIILPGVDDIDDIVTRNIDELVSNAGQTCSALTRLVVPRSVLPEVEAAAIAAARAQVLGDPMDPDTTLGPIVSARQLSQVRTHIERAESTSARLIVGGSAEIPSGQGYLVPPTVFSDVTPDMAIAQEEVFGPVLVIMPYDTVDEAISIANSTNYGLSGAVWGRTTEEAVDVAKSIRSGQVRINGAYGSYSAPFGGYKQSGNGRELGRDGLLEFFETKAVAL